jgi:guanylate kinase
MNQSSTTPGTLYVIAAPSGAGKTSLVKALLETTDGITVSISHTTRAMRPGEEDGVHYHFVDAPTFQDMEKRDAFLEHAQVFDNFYGTSKQAVLEQLNRGLDVILEIDWQGARQVREIFTDCVGIFILPPSKKSLLERLTGRGTDSEEIIQRRMRDAEAEISHYDEFDYVVINDDFDTALAELRAVVLAQRLRLEHQGGRLKDLMDDLLA